MGSYFVKIEDTSDSSSPGADIISPTFCVRDIATQTMDVPQFLELSSDMGFLNESHPLTYQLAHISCPESQPGTPAHSGEFADSSHDDSVTSTTSQDQRESSIDSPSTWLPFVDQGAPNGEPFYNISTEIANGHGDSAHVNSFPPSLPNSSGNIFCPFGDSAPSTLALGHKESRSTTNDSSVKEAPPFLEVIKHETQAHKSVKDQVSYQSKAMAEMEQSHPSSTQESESIDVPFELPFTFVNPVFPIENTLQNSDLVGEHHHGEIRSEPFIPGMPVFPSSQVQQEFDAAFERSLDISATLSWNEQQMFNYVSQERSHAFLTPDTMGELSVKTGSDTARNAMNEPMSYLQPQIETRPDQQDRLHQDNTVEVLSESETTEMEWELSCDLNVTGSSKEPQGLNFDLPKQLHQTSDLNFGMDRMICDDEENQIVGSRQQGSFVAVSESYPDLPGFSKKQRGNASRRNPVKQSRYSAAIRKVRQARGIPHFGIYIRRVSREVFDDEKMQLSGDFLQDMDEFVKNMLDIITDELRILYRHSPYKTLTHGDIETALTLRLPPKLAYRAKCYASQALMRLSKYSLNSRKSLC